METSTPRLKHRRLEDDQIVYEHEEIRHSSKKFRGPDTQTSEILVEKVLLEKKTSTDPSPGNNIEGDDGHILHLHAPVQTKQEKRGQEKNSEYQRRLSGETPKPRMAHSATPLSVSEDDGEDQEPKYFVSGRTVSNHERDMGSVSPNGAEGNGYDVSESSEESVDWVLSIPNDPKSLDGYVDYVRLYGFAKFAALFSKVHPAAILKAFGCPISEEFLAQWRSYELLPVVHYIISQKLDRPLHSGVKTLEDVVLRLKEARKIMVISGAGISVSCGIPDFRSEGGIYSQVAQYGIQEPTDMFDLSFFRKNPVPFYMFAKEIWPENFKPSPSHLFIKILEDNQQLLRDYTQNIDHIESRAGISKVLQCHGSFATATCTHCRHTVPGTDIREAVLSNQIPRCTECAGPEQAEGLGGVLKPDIIFFGESLPDDFDEFFVSDRSEVDLVLIMGSSLKVAPVSELIRKLKPDVPQVLINREHLAHLEHHFDVQLLGFCDEIVAELCRRCGWDLKHPSIFGKGSLSGEFIDRQRQKLRHCRKVEQVILYRIPNEEGNGVQAEDSPVARRIYQDPPPLVESSPSPLYYYLPLNEENKPVFNVATEEEEAGMRKMYFFKGAKYRGLEIGPEGLSAGRILRTSNKTGLEDTTSDIDDSEAEDEDFVPFESQSESGSSLTDSSSSTSSSSSSSSSGSGSLGSSNSELDKSVSEKSDSRSDVISS